jgi:6-phosphogluconolactonase
MIDIRVVETPDEVAAEAARLAAASLQKALATQDLVTFVLAGGRVPPIANAILSEKYAKDLDWKRILFLIGDERCVPLDDAQSSWLSALPLLEAHPEIPANHKLRPQSQLSAEAAAASYARILLDLPQNQSGLPIINHLWLGIGEDGHTLSLFPGHPSSTQRTGQLVTAVHDSPKPPPDRISFTYRALEGVKSAVAFISGGSKAPIVAEIANGNHSLPIVIASKTIEKAGGQVIWLVDKAAMAQIPQGQYLNL